MRDDDLVLAGTLQDLVHGCVDTLCPLRLRLGARHALVMVHPLPDSRRWDEAPVQSFLWPPACLTVGLLPQPTIKGRLHVEQRAYCLGGLTRALQVRGEQLHLDAVRDPSPKRSGDGSRRTNTGRRQARVVPSADDSVDVVRRFRVGDDVESAHKMLPSG